MSSARPPVPARDTGLPPGVQVGSLGRRFVAYLIDSVIPAVAGVMVLVGMRGSTGAGVALVVVALLLGLAWAFVCWQQLAVNAASPGMRVMKLQLVGFFDGRPVRWGRVFLRWLLFAVLSATGLGLVLLVVSVLVSPRHQGWHERVASAVVIVERPLAPRHIKVRTARTTQPATARKNAVTAEAAETSSGSAPAPSTPVAVPVAVAGDPAIGPDLAPLAAEPLEAAGVAEDETAPVAATNGAHRTILDGWVAELDDGRVFPVRGLVLLGRNPQPSDGEADAELVKLPDESRTVSKTHLALGVDDAGLFIVDRGSTNGSTVTPPGQPTAPVGAFSAVSVSEGSVVSIGDHWVRIRRDAG